MHLTRTCGASALLLAAHAATLTPACAQTAPQAMQQVVVTAGAADASLASRTGATTTAKATRGPLAARVNLARNWSRVDSMPRPYNHIEVQPAYSGNLGLDYAAPNGRADLGGTWTVRGPVRSRASALSLSDDGMRRQLDLYAVWKRDARSRLRLSMSNLGQRHYRESVQYQGSSPLIRATIFRLHPTWRLVWEHSL